MNHILRDSIAVTIGFQRSLHKALMGSTARIAKYVAVVACGCCVAAMPVSAAPAPATTAPVETKAPVKKKPLTKLAEPFDTDHDGVLNPTELKAFEDSKTASAQKRRADELAKYDTNHDGKINKDERAKIMADKEVEKAKLDADKAKAKADKAKLAADEKAKAAKDKAAGVKTTTTPAKP